MARKIEKALYGPSLTEVVLGALLGLLSGVAVACIYLVFKQVPTVRELPKEQPRGMVYYISGSDSSAKSAGWQAKQNLFLAGKSVQLVEEELNAWLSASMAASPQSGSAEASKAKDSIFTPSKPNFKIVNDRLQLGMNCTLNWYGMMKDVTLQTSGTFEKKGDHFVFKPEKLYLGSCPLHFIPGASGLLVSIIVDKEKVPDEFRVAWNNLNDVVVAGGTLKLVAAQ